MGEFIFYYKCLLIVSFSLIVMGIYVAFFKNTFLFIPFTTLIDPVFCENGIIDNGVLLFKGFMYSVFGTAIIIWGIHLFYITKFAFKKKENWAWWSILISTLVWYPISSGFSVYYKVYYNAIFGFPFLLLLILSLILSKKYFNNPGLKNA